MVVVAAVLRFMLVAGFHVLVFLVHNPLAGIPVAVAGWVVFVHFKPYRPCLWCKTPEQRKRRKGRQCWRCKGTKLTRRIGARHVHKVKLALQQQQDEREWFR